MAKNGKKSDSAWTKKSGSTASKSSTVLPGKPGETVGRSTPPWPISEFPPFRHNDSKRVINESPGKPYRD
jgi:hypothetical protein